MVDSTIVSAITDVLIAVIGFGGGIGVSLITQNHTDKRHDKDLDVQSETELRKHIQEIDAKHRSDIENIRIEYQKSFEETNKRLDKLFDEFTELRGIVQQSQATIELRIASLEKKQDKHNGIIERTFKLEERATLAEEQIKVANHRIQDLESRN